ncbi:hypothetical protein DER45DRAFT_548868 [Fusarium avenaceum]|nr:hypothetical protein DER45DRAFT_548868 [Fusarium avenaceum]
MYPALMMDSNMIAENTQHYADSITLLHLQSSFTAVINISCPIPPSNVKYPFRSTKSIDGHNNIKSDFSGAFFLTSDHCLKYQILLVENIAPHSCVGGCKSSNSAYRSQDPRGDGNRAGVKKHKAQHGSSTRDFGETNGDDQNQDPGGARGALGADDMEASAKLLACLFQKFDPIRYDECSRYRLSSWDRVLQHLKRRHLLRGEYCPTCRKEFQGRDAEDNKNEHIRGGCLPTTAVETGRLLQEEYDNLTGVGPGDQVTKWFKGWAILFRGYPEPPSPFAQTLLEANCDVTRGRLPEIVQSFKRDRGQPLTDEDLADLGRRVLDEVEHGTLCTPPRQVLQFTSAQLSTTFDTMAFPLECEVATGYHMPFPPFGSSLAIVPNVPLSFPESRSPPTMHWSIPETTYTEPLESYIQPFTTISDSSDHAAVLQPPIFQWDPLSHEQDLDNIFQQLLDESISRQPVDSLTQNPNDAVARYIDFSNFSNYPVLEDGIEDVTDFADDGVPTS